MSPTTITCPSCNHVNEPTRVFCHNCGVRLPRDEAVVEQIAATNEAAAAKAGQVRRNEIPRPRSQVDWSGLAASTVTSLIKLALSAALVAAIILALRTPIGLPSPAPKDSEMVQRGDAQLEIYLQPAVEGTLKASATELNTYLQTKLHLTSQVPLPGAATETTTPFIQLGSQQFTLGNQFSVLGFPITIRTIFHLKSMADGHPALLVGGGHLGDLPLPAVLLKILPNWYDPIRESLQPQLDALSRAREVEITPELVRVQW